MTLFQDCIFTSDIEERIFSMIRGNLPKIEDNTYITAIHNAINKSQLDPGNVASTGYVVSM